MKRLLLAVLAASFVSPVYAQPKTPTLTTTIQARIAQFESVTIDDLTAAKAVFDAAKNANGSACAAAWLTVAQANAAATTAAINGTPTAPTGNPGILTLLAKGYNIHVALQSGSPMRTACAPMMDDLRNSGLTAGGGILGGVSVITKLVPVLAMFGL